MLFARTLERLRRRQLIDRLQTAVLAGSIAMLGSIATMAAPAEAGDRSEPATAAADTAPGNLGHDAIRQVDEHHYQIRCNAWEAIAAAASAERVRLVPTWKDGDRIGLNVFVIQPGSRADRLGLENGDTLRSIDGRAILSPEEVVGACQDAKGQREITLRLLR
jgi:type II secretory pathway component PulC